MPDSRIFPPATAKLAGMKLNGAGFQHLCMSQFDLSRGDFRAADLRGDCSHVKFCKINSRKARLSGGQFAHSDFSDSNLTGAAMEEADMMGCQFVQTVLKRADLRGTKSDRVAFEDVIWQSAVFDEPTRFSTGFAIPPEPNWRQQ